MIELKRNFLDQKQNKFLFYWIHENENLSGEEKKFFSVTYKKDEIPDYLKFAISDKFNLYNFLGFVSEKGGSVPPHIDTDLFVRIKEEYPDIIISLPETQLYYVDICEDMVGGFINANDQKFRPISNSSLTLPQNTLHSVDKIEHLTRPRTALVIEKYFIFKKDLEKIKTPLYSKG